MKKYIYAILVAFCGVHVNAETITEGFEAITITDADSWNQGTILSNGWIVVAGKIASTADATDYGIWAKGYPENTGHSLTAQYSGTNNAFVACPELVQGNLTLYARKTSTSSSTAGTLKVYILSKEGDSYVVSSTAKTQTLTTSWVKYTIDLGNTPVYVGFNLVRAAIDDVELTMAAPAHETHDYSTEWTGDETGHWHQCLAEGYCDAPQADFAPHDGLLCSVCGYKAPGVEVFPWTEDFEGISSGIPAGWDNSEGTTTSESYKWTYYNSYSDGKSVRFDSYNNSEGKTNVLATPWLYLLPTGTYELKFRCKNPKGGKFEVKIAEYGSDNRVVLFDNLTDIASWTEKSASLADYAGKAVKIYFCGTSNWGSGDAYIYLDDVTIKETIAHNHSYSTEWSVDGHGHWHACTSETGECDAPKGDYADHSYDENDICIVCGYDKPFEVDFAIDEIPAEWIYNGWVKDGDHIASGNYDTNILTTSYLKAKTGQKLEVEAFLRYTDEPLTMEYSTNQGATWTEAFSVVSDADHYSGGEAKILTFVAPADGEYQLRFWGQYTGINRITGFKDAYMKDLVESTLTISSSNMWATVCYPSDLTLAEGVQAYKAVGVNEDDIVELLAVEDMIPANTPVVLFAGEGAVLTLPATKHVTSCAETVVEEGNLLVGCTGVLTLNQPTQYVLQNHAEQVAFYRVNPDKPITTVAYRCYLCLPSKNASSKLNFVIVENESNGITEVSISEDTSIYDLTGRKVEHMQKGGIYVVGNKKVIVR